VRRSGLADGGAIVSDVVEKFFLDLSLHHVDR